VLTAVPDQRAFLIVVTEDAKSPRLALMHYLVEFLEGLFMQMASP
jgi:hypothetical protein